MGSARKIDQARRQATLLGMLREQALGSLAISASLGVTQRAVQKDLQQLRAEGHRIEVRRGTYHLIEDRGGHPLEHLALLCAVQLLEARGNEDQSWREAIEGLKNKLPSPMRRMLAGESQKPARGGRHLERLSQAVLDERKVDLRYETDRSRWRRVSVQRLEIDPASGQLYAVVSEERAGHELIKTYRASRIVDTRPTSEASERWPGPLGRLGLTRQASIKVLFRAGDEGTRRAVAEAISCVPGLSAAGTWQEKRRTKELQAELLAWVTEGEVPLLDLPWLLGWGRSLEVTGPPKAREAFLKASGRKR